MTMLPTALSITAALQWAQGELSASTTPRLDAEVLLAEVLQQTRTYLHTWPERELETSQLQRYRTYVARRKEGQPIAHLLGTREFWSLELKVDGSTLIPRPDTEILVAQALQLELPEQAKVLDLGTGTGAIALALKSERPAWQVSAVDQSAAAVDLARSNAQQLNLAVTIQQSDWFAALSSAPEEGFDCIVSNPPYIAEDDPHLDQGDVRFEPRTALVAGDHGCADLSFIIAQARGFLKPGGWLLLEHGWQQANVCQQQFKSNGYTSVASARDYANLERISFAQWPALQQQTGR
ncbi:Release factor glutamine methyltransferase [Pseudidiomarina piscicola]|uniref:Release factor glutamine methyltransferase n=1 Tax=Pseudidiomarina piscicola TaxID=2614830 RepID=A0A6S6WL09_9GAMM|nr:Release factor glutamine methyltransferase [Pseudidiomarina piscicola]VZT39089.1 Release factor glutamine methyltransferase [Pseudomonas aeruginosa]